MASFHPTLLCLVLATACSSGDGSDLAVLGPGTAADGGGGPTPTGVSPTATFAGELVQGCPGQELRQGIPADLAADGPWPVGSRTVELSGLVTEIWYPAVQGSDAGKAQIVYDMREHLPPDDAAKMPDDHVPTHACHCVRDLPLDEEAGPYPVVVFVHGTAGFRTTNVDTMSHWASRGFVVVAADHPGIQLKDLLGSVGGGRIGGAGGGGGQEGEARAMLQELAATQGALSFLKGRIDMQKVGLMGHSAGGGAVAAMGDVADVIIVYAAGGSVREPMRARSMLNVMGATDGVAGSRPAGYEGSTTQTRRFLSIARGGHLVGSNLCTMRDPEDPTKDIVDLAEEYRLGGPLGAIPGAVRTLFGQLFDGCNELADDDTPFIAASRGIAIMNYASSGALEEALHCADTAAALTDLGKTYGADVADYRQMLP